MATVAIREPDAGWPVEFGHTAGEVRALLGALAHRIDHVGSTSVPGLASKDVIDVQVTVAGEDAMDEAAERLGRAGLQVSPPGMNDHVAPRGRQGPLTPERRLARGTRGAA